MPGSIHVDRLAGREVAPGSGCNQALGCQHERSELGGWGGLAARQTATSGLEEGRFPDETRTATNAGQKTISTEKRRRRLSGSFFPAPVISCPTLRLIERSDVVRGLDEAITALTMSGSPTYGGKVRLTFGSIPFNS